LTTSTSGGGSSLSGSIDAKTLDDAKNAGDEVVVMTKIHENTIDNQRYFFVPMRTP
jgi:hypothetical protein